MAVRSQGSCGSLILIMYMYICISTRVTLDRLSDRFVVIITNHPTGFYLEILFWGGNMVDGNSKKGHNTLLCTVGAFATSQL